jgi:hypothetical protein
MSVMKEYLLSGGNSKGPSGRNVSMDWLLKVFSPGDNCRISGTHHFTIADLESCQRFEVTKSGLKIQVLAYRLFQMVSAFPRAHHYQAVLA